MSWPKSQLVTEAYNELALAGWIFDVSPEESLHGLIRLEAQMGEWEGKGIRVGYAFSSDAPNQADLDADSGLPPMAWRPVFMNLAVDLAAGFGKQLMPSTMKGAADGYDTLLWAAAMPTEQQLPDRLPRGAGNKPWRINDWPFFPPADPSPLGNSPGPGLDILE